MMTEHGRKTKMVACGNAQGPESRTQASCLLTPAAASPGSVEPPVYLLTGVSPTLHWHQIRFPTGTILTRSSVHAPRPKPASRDPTEGPLITSGEFCMKFEYMG
jgi:hypothetical protein